MTVGTEQRHEARAARSGNGLGAIAVVATGCVLAQAINAAAMVALTRLYLPEHYAGWAVLITLAAMVGALACLRYELAIVVIPDRADAAGVFWSCLLLSLATGGLVTAALSAISQSGIWAGHLGILLDGWRYALVTLVISAGVYQACYAWCTREGWFTLMSFAGVMSVVFVAGAQIGVGLTTRAGTSGLVWGSVLGQIGASALLLAAVLMQPSGPLRAGVSLDRLKSLMVAHHRFPIYMAPYSLVAGLRDRLALVLFSAMAPAAQVGQYAFSNRLVNMPLGLVGNAVRPIVFHNAAAADGESVERLIMDVLHLLQKCVMPFLLLFLWRASDVFVAAFGAEWGGASLYAVALALPAFVLLHTSWLDRLLDIAGRQRLALSMETAFSAVSIVTVVIALAYWRSMLPVVIVQGVVTVVYNIVWLTVVFRISGLRVSEIAALGWALVRRAATWSVVLLTLEGLGGSLGTQAYVAVATAYVAGAIASALYRSGGVLKPAIAEPS